MEGNNNKNKNSLELIIREGRMMMGRGRDISAFAVTVSMSEERRFRAFFGASPLTIAESWEQMGRCTLMDGRPEIKHLLWAYFFLKVYAKENVLAGISGVTEKTFRKWCRLMLGALAGLESSVIVWSNRFKDDAHNDCLVSVDGTDFSINRPNKTCGRSFYGYKFKKCGLRYEAAVSIRGGDLVWINGPFPCGRWNDIMIFRSSLMTHLGPFERVEADDGYIGEAPRYVKCPKCLTNTRANEQMQQRCRSRQETLNNRFKYWGALKQTFRHDVNLHSIVFRAVAVITQIQIQGGEPLFALDYVD